VKERFSKKVAENQGWKCKSMSAAKHRFESLRSPLSKVVLHLHSIMLVMEEISVERRGKAEGKIASQFLEKVSIQHILFQIG